MERVLLEGIPASAGIGTGEAIVLTSPEDFDRMLDGAVLVCPQTDPEWLPVMVRAAAIVTDEGGRMSHAAIVCREMGTPAVVGTGRGTSLLRKSQRITVDGSRGVVLDA